MCIQILCPKSNLVDTSEVTQYVVCIFTKKKLNVFCDAVSRAVMNEKLEGISKEAVMA